MGSFCSSDSHDRTAVPLPGAALQRKARQSVESDTAVPATRSEEKERITPRPSFDDTEDDFESDYETGSEYSDQPPQEEDLFTEDRDAQFEQPTKEVFDAMQQEIMLKTAETANLMAKLEEREKELRRLREANAKLLKSPEHLCDAGGAAMVSVAGHSLSIDATATIVDASMCPFLGYFSFEFLTSEVVMRDFMAASGSHSELASSLSLATHTRTSGEDQSDGTIALVLSEKAKLSDKLDAEWTTKIVTMLESYQPNAATLSRFLQVLYVAETRDELMRRVVVMALIYAAVTDAVVGGSTRDPEFVCYLTSIDFKAIYESVYLFGFELTIVDDMLKSLTAELVMLSKLMIGIGTKSMSISSDERMTPSFGSIDVVAGTGLKVVPMDASDAEMECSL